MMRNVFPNVQIFKVQTHNIKPLVPQIEKLQSYKMKLTHIERSKVAPLKAAGPLRAQAHTARQPEQNNPRVSKAPQIAVSQAEKIICLIPDFQAILSSLPP